MLHNITGIDDSLSAPIIAERCAGTGAAVGGTAVARGCWMAAFDATGCGAAAFGAATCRVATGGAPTGPAAVATLRGAATAAGGAAIRGADAADSSTGTPFVAGELPGDATVAGAAVARGCGNRTSDCATSSTVRVMIPSSRTMTVEACFPLVTSRAET